ncbi:hypothetical protein DFA_00534 [Cavenderia fasciculata]|uniref:Uncharacterized protein n=1 Tax=Cavenderia fasciculata TaxID=261658 RepID=F4PSC7_CACFS|nr:uncharacterized protein DFA_00534 [Cavenderia fasciculata]EGG20673.1 hypothetical protein DFA_00534 [Cavenderia fasciculata]|eukprot:XP_004358523.1 hypothetical protein DFA_00534 [Cavenderia fasciculata]
MLRDITLSIISAYQESGVSYDQCYARNMAATQPWEKTLNKEQKRQLDTIRYIYTDNIQLVWKTTQERGENTTNIDGETVKLCIRIGKDGMMERSIMQVEEDIICDTKVREYESRISLNIYEHDMLWITLYKNGNFIQHMNRYVDVLNGMLVLNATRNNLGPRSGIVFSTYSKNIFLVGGYSFQSADGSQSLTINLTFTHSG